MSTVSDSIELPTLDVTESALSSPSPWSDRVGIIASVGCAIHCAAMPFVIAWLPALGLSFLAEEGFHQWMAVLCFGLALAAFVPGWRSHRRLLPAVIGATGLILITGAAFGLEGDCCAACQDAQSAAVAAESASPDLEATCTADNCAFCAAERSAADTERSAADTERSAAETERRAAEIERRAAEAEREASGPSESETVAMAGFAPSGNHALLKTITPWLTPIGGLLLVSAHLLNRRFGSQCGCCPTAPNAE